MIRNGNACNPEVNMVKNDEPVREKIIKYLKDSDGHTLREITEHLRTDPSDAIDRLRPLAQKGMLFYLHGLWRTR